MTDFKFRQGLLTICNFYKCLIGPVDDDLSTIITPNLQSQTCEYTKTVNEIVEHFEKEFLPTRNIQKFKPSSRSVIFDTPKASANGPNAMGESSITDAMACGRSSLRKIQDSMARLVYEPDQYEN